MNQKIIKTLKVIIISAITCLLFFVSNIFANIQVNTSLGIRQPGANIIFTPPKSTGFFTSGNVYAEVTGNGNIGPIYMLTGNGTYTFNYRRGIGAYTTGAGFSLTNRWTLLSTIDTVTRIDKIPPTFSGIQSGYTYNTDVTITFADNNSGVTATIDGSGFTNGSTVISNGTHILVVTDIAGNSTGAKFSIEKSIAADIIYTPPQTSGFFTSGDVIATITGFNKSGVLITGIIITNNSGSEYTFSGNGIFIFTYRDPDGNTGATTANVTRIDKISPTFSGANSGTYYPNNISITFDDLHLSGAILNGSAYTSGTLITGDGIYTFIVSDLAGNSTGTTFVIDQTAPTYTGVIPGGFYSGDVAILFSDLNLSGATIDGNPYTGGTSITGEDVHTFEVIDKAGNISSATFVIDKTPPTYSGFIHSGTYNTDITITFADNRSGVSATLNGLPLTYGTTITENGTYILRVTDLAGNSITKTCTIDKTITASIEYDPGSRTITSGDVIATITGFNKTGITITSGGPNHTFTDNDTSFVFTYQDTAGNTGETTATVTRIDKTPPTYSNITNGTTYTNNVTIYFADNRSGVSATINNAPFTNGDTIATNGTYTLKVTDVAGNVTTATFTINKTTSGGGGGGGGGGGPVQPTNECLTRTCNNSYYDALCGPCQQTPTSGIVQEKTVIVDYRIIHGYSNDYTNYDLGGNLTRDQLAKIMVRTLTDQKFVQPYETPDRGQRYRNDLKNMGITDFQNINGEQIVDTNMVATMIIRGHEYRKITDTNAAELATEIAQNNQISRGRILELITTYLLPHLGFEASPDNGITGKLRISLERFKALNIDLNTLQSMLKEQNIQINENNTLPSTKTPTITPTDTKTYSKEMLDAYKYAYALGITTQGTVKEAKLDGPLIRKELAKMISEYATKIIGLKPDNSKKCDFTDITNESEEMKYYIRLSCKLGVMGLNADGITVRDTFLPNELVNRAQFGTVFSRLIFGGTYNLKGNELSLFNQAMNKLSQTAGQLAQLFGIKYSANVSVDRYTKHLEALKQNNVMQQIQPFVDEIRGYVMMMMMRADKNGIIQVHAGEQIKK